VWPSSSLPRNAYASFHLLANQINYTAYHKHLLNTVDCIHCQKTNSGVVDNLIAFSALLVCILPHCLLRDWCGILRNDSGQKTRGLSPRPISVIPHFRFHILLSAFRIPQFRILPTAFRDTLTVMQENATRCV